MADPFGGPSTKLVEVTPSDTTNLTGTRGLLVNGAGNVAVRMVHDPETTVTVYDVQPGAILPFRVTRVMAATTATNITAIF